MAAILDSLLYSVNPTATSSLNYLDPILFNYNYVIDSPTINVDSTTGKFTISQPGNYLINWWVVTQSSDSSLAIGFALKGKAASATTYDSYQAAVNTLKTGEISGTSILALTPDKIPYTFQLVNITGYSQGLSSTVILALYTTAQAGITISQLSDGTEGATGPTGPAGPAGIQGVTGVTGPQGSQGNTGPQGIPGATGMQGIPGVTGATGNDGSQGATGPQGTRGPQGIAGPRGSVGPQGPRGPQGVAGPEGPQGPQGVAGPNGIPTKTSAFTSSITTLPASNIVYQAPFIFNNTIVDFVMSIYGSAD